MGSKKLPPLTPFGVYVEEKCDNDVDEVARQLGITRSYVYLLKTGSATPKLGMGFVIEDWAKGHVPIGSWKPWTREFRK